MDANDGPRPKRGPQDDPGCCGGAYCRSIGQFFIQLRILLWKNLILSYRNWKGTLGQLIAPVLVVLLLLGSYRNSIFRKDILRKFLALKFYQRSWAHFWALTLPSRTGALGRLPIRTTAWRRGWLCSAGFQLVGQWVLNQTNEHPLGVPYANKIPPCIVGPGMSGCTTMRYAPQNVTWVDNLMRRVAHRSDLDFDTHFKNFDVGNFDISQNITEILNNTIYNFFRTHQNETQNVVVFTGALLEQAFSPNELNFTVPPNQLGYIVFYNFTSTNGLVPEVIKMVEQEVMALKANISLDNATLPTIDIVHTKFPQPKQRVAGLDAVGLFGATWFFLPPMVTFFILLVEIVGEKEKRLRIGMRMMGLSNTVYWVVWFITGTIFITLISLMLFLAGFACRMPFFTNANFFAVELLFWVFGMSMLCVCFFVSTLMSSTRTAQTTGYAIVLIGFVFQSILSSAEGRLADMLWADDVPDWVVLIKWILTFYPPFNFAKAFSDYARRSSATIDVAAGLVKEGKGMFWDDLYKNETLNFPAFKVYVNVPAPIEQIGWMILNAAIFAVLAWYFDNVLAGEHGSPRPFYFLLTPEYWGCCRGRSKKKHLRDALDIRVPREGDEDYDSDVEREAVETQRAAANEFANPGSSEPPAVRLVNLTKEYRKSALCRTKSDTKAVDNISLTINHNEIFCLLGHNGAGKTTTINMLTGLFHQTSGEAQICGMDIIDQMDEIREQLGVCPQHDILWPELTAREHLTLFAQLKGIPSFLIAREVHEKIQQVGLEEAADQPTGSYSGGMKRRLSVAIATIGNPAVVFMDEPTTGLDPVNKRGIWHLIQSMKKNRCIITTTHSMEEADVLSDRIAIMAFGKLRCLGNGLHLKAKYGSGYRITLLTETEHSREVIRRIEDRFPGLVHVSANDAGAVALNVPQARIDTVPDLIAYIESLRTSTDGSDELIHEWGISHSTLEEVFLAITKKHHFIYDDIDPDLDPDDDESDATKISNMPSVHDGPSSSSSQPRSPSIQHKGFSENPDAKQIQLDEDEPSDTKPLLDNQRDQASTHPHKKQRPPSHPFRALFRKNLTLQARQKFTNICQILTPVLVIIILVILRQIISSKVGTTTITEFFPTVPFPLNAQGLEMPNINMNPALTHKNNLAQYVIAGMAAHASSAPSKLDPTNLDSLFDKAEDLLRIGSTVYRGGQAPREVIWRGADGVVWLMFSDSNSIHVKAGNLTGDGSRSGLLGELRQYKVVWTPPHASQKNSTLSPYFVDYPTEYDIQSAIYAVESSYDNTSITDLRQPPTNLLMPDGYVSFYDIDASRFYTNFSISVNDLPYRDYHRLNNFTKISIPGRSGFSLKDPLVRPDLGQYQVVQMISRAFTKWSLFQRGIDITDNSTSIPSEWRNLLDSTWIWPSPYYSSQDIWALLEAFGVLLYPVALTLQLPIYIYILVLEKYEKLREMMLSHGMKLWHYNLTNYTFFSVLYTLIAAAFWLSGIGFDMRFFVSTHWSTLLVYFVGWGMAAISLAFFLSALVNSPRASTVVGYAIALLGSMIGIILAVGIYGPTPFSVGHRMPNWLLMWPQFAFVRGLYLMNEACAQKHLCVDAVWTLHFDDELSGTLIALYAAAVIYFILFLYLDAVLPRQYGVPKHPLFFIYDLIGCCSAKNRRAAAALDSKRRLSNPNLPRDDDTEAIMRMKEDEDVAAERTRVHAGHFDVNDIPLVLRDLRKVYEEASPPKVAVKSLCLLVPEGECFGLLGENGAGKTTTISMLTGLFPPTAGSAFVGGFDIATEIDKVHLSMGLCPQFDVLWGDLTVEEHLLYYCRLKGVDPDHERAHVKRLMRDVGLHTSKSKLASDLSGGMKRRLSIAISLVGNSKIVFLDEPTTGLDPVSRRQIWAIIHRAKRGRAIVLVSHAMDETELLCNRIGIMAKGTMRCLGNQQRLKNRFGGGYILKLNFNPDRVADVDQLVQGRLPGAVLSGDFTGTKEYRLDPSISIGDVFLTMERESRGAGIVDWAISQVGLEDVFQRIIDESKRSDE